VCAHKHLYGGDARPLPTATVVVRAKHTQQGQFQAG